MKKVFAALLGLLGLAWLRKRVEMPPPAADPAEELRAKLAESRETAEAQAEDAAAEQPVDEADVPDVATRRSEVHDRARRAMDDLSSSDS